MKWLANEPSELRHVYYRHYRFPSIGASEEESRVWSYTTCFRHNCTTRCARNGHVKENQIDLRSVIAQ